MFYVNLNKAHVFMPRDEEDYLKEEISLARGFLQSQGVNEGIFDLSIFPMPLPLGSIIEVIPDRPAAVAGVTYKNGVFIHVLVYAVSPKGL